MQTTLNRASLFSPVGAVVQQPTTPSQINGNSFAAMLMQAYGTGGAQSTQSAKPANFFSPFSQPGWYEKNVSSKAYADQAGFQTWPARVNPYATTGTTSGKTSGSQKTGDVNNGLPDAISTHKNGYFSQNITTSGEERVGSDVYQFHFQHIVEKDGVQYAYFIDHSNGSLNDVGLATSTDGVNFDYKGKVLTRGEDYDAEQASFPDVQYDDETKTWYMLYEAKSAEKDVNSVCLATSGDGLNWDKKGPVISPGGAGAMSAVDVGTPTMFKEDGEWHVYFHGLAKDGRVRIGYASGESLDDLTVQKGALLDVDATGFETGTVGARSNIVKKDGWYYMAYEVSTADTQFADASWGINLARSRTPDGDWEKLAGGPLVSNPEEGFGYDGPELALDGDQLYLYYRTESNTSARTEILGLGDMRSASMA